MIKFYYNLAPNPMKVALALEDMGLAYELCPVDTRKGEQHEAAYLAINPNAKVPAIIDGDASVFDSNAILLYLAEKTGKDYYLDLYNNLRNFAYGHPEAAQILRAID